MSNLNAKLQKKYRKAINLHKRGKFDRSIEIFKEILNEVEDPRVYYNLANVYYDIGDNENAREMYEEALKMEPGIAATWYNYGNTLSDLNLFEEAINAYDHAIEIKPNYVEAIFNKAVLLMKNNQLDDAEKLYLQIETIDSNFHYALYNLACLYTQLENFNLAINYLAKVMNIECEIDYREFAYNDPSLSVLKGKKDFEELFKHQ